MLKLASVELGGAPCVVLAVRDGVDRCAVDDALHAGASIVELRVDEFSSTDTAFVLAEARKYEGLPVLGTIRAASEGGAWAGTDAARAALYEALIPQVAAVDIELSSLDTIENVVATAHDAGRLVLGSHHDFERTPSREQLDALLAEGKARGVDIVKIAAWCNAPEDVRTLARFTLAHANENVVTIGMGPEGVVTRILFPALGSLLTYTFLGEPTAPGQLNCGETLKYLKALYPNFGTGAE